MTPRHMSIFNVFINLLYKSQVHYLYFKCWGACFEIHIYEYCSFLSSGIESFIKNLLLHANLRKCSCSVGVISLMKRLDLFSINLVSQIKIIFKNQTTSCTTMISFSEKKSISFISLCLCLIGDYTCTTCKTCNRPFPSSKRSHSPS